MKHSTIKDITSPRIQALKAKIRHIGGVVFSLKMGNAAQISASTNQYRERAIMAHERSQSTQSIEEFLKKKRHQLTRELYRERSKEAYNQARTNDTQQIKQALRSGSTKRMVNEGISPIGLPVMVSDPDQPEQIPSSPEKVQTMSAQYFSNLYSCKAPPKTPKPWLETPPVQEAKEKVQAEPFKWPQEATVQGFRAMLRKGNPKPSPGPDGWEKWCIKALSDKTLELVVRLHNYMVRN